MSNIQTTDDSKPNTSPLGFTPGMRLADFCLPDICKSNNSHRISHFDPRLETEKKRAEERLSENQQTFGENLQDDLTLYQAGSITRRQAEYRMKREIREHYRTAFELGKRKAGNLYLTTPHEENWLRKLRYDEFRYLKRFLDDVDNGRGVMPYEQRMDMYTKSIREVAWMGWVIGNRDRRRRITWHWNPDKDHCATCKGYNGRTWTVEQFLKHVQKTGHLPQSGSLDCLGYRCGCWLTESFVGGKTSGNS